ncbi:MAG: pyridoxal phosphate-dependent aminotransferase [Candidatus Sericytochromatia bacterium]|nr:pyridoxal phosphate-dependent aminotransferase [Candidatus Sericytochromatia bacterium]
MNPQLSAIPASLIRAIHAKKQPGDIDLGLGEPLLRPDLAPFERATAWVQRHGCPYTPNAGALDLREAIAASCAYPGLDQPENVCVTVGSQEALYLAIKVLCDPACHEVLIVAPCYPAYAKLCALEGIAHRFVVMDSAEDYAPDPARVLAALSPNTRLIVLATPANPTGRVWSAAALLALAEGLSQRGGERPYVLIDEVYRALCYVEPRPPSLASLYDRTLVANSLSKSHALTGLRLGWLLAPKPITEAVVKAHQFLLTSASTYSQRVAHAVLTESPGIEAALAHYLAQRQAIRAALSHHRLRHIAPEGAFYTLVALPPDFARTSLDAALALLESQRVVTIPGSAFEAEGWLRLSWVAPVADLQAGAARIAAFFDHPDVQTPT